MLTREAIEESIKSETNALNVTADALVRHKACGHPLSDDVKKYLSRALRAPKGRAEIAKAMRLRIRLFGTAQSLPEWVEPTPTDALDRRIGERLRADLPKRIGFMRLTDAL